jgi:alanine racemase
MPTFLSFDTRKLVIPERTIFFALKGEQKDGHRFVQDAYQQGVRDFVVQKGFDTSAFVNARFVEVEDVLQHLHQVALAHRQQFDLQVIGITGSNGKTIVKEWLNFLLSKKKPTKIVCNPKSYNSQIGVPLSIWEIGEQHDIGIFEAGISTVGEMQQLAPLIDCETGIFTNIGSAHDEGFDNRTQKVTEKATLFNNAKTIIYNSDFELIDTVIRQKYPNKKLVTWSFYTATADLFISKISYQQYTRIEGVWGKEKVFIEIPFADKASVENAINCWLTLLVLGFQTSELQADFRQLPPVALRLELKPAVNNSTLIDDSYSLDLNSLNIALDFLVQQHTTAKRTLILSDILQSGLAKADLYQTVATRLQLKKINRLIGIGSEIQVIRQFLGDDIETTFYSSTADFLREFKAAAFQNESILLKGARIFEFERIAKILERQLHQAVLEVNLNALASNLRVYRRYLKPTTKLMTMVKAAAYGSGIGEVARFLEYQNVDYLAVAYTDEGVMIRNAGVHLPILVLNPDIGTFEKLFVNRLEPEIYSFELLEAFLKSLENTRMLYPDLDLDNYPIHIKLDTGMKRLGFEMKDMERLKERLENVANIRVKSVFSHLVASDAKEHDSFTAHQISTYQNMCTMLFESLTYTPLQHILNSGGITRFEAAQMNMVRLGIGLYGTDAQPTIQRKLQPVSTLKTTISQIKHVKKGETIGYNRAGKAEQDTRIATIGIGYADGFARALSNGVGEVFLNGKMAKVIGNVCMDMTMIDISDIPTAKVGDEVEIFGQHISVQALAKKLNTIPYEVFTNISERVKRVYFQE